MNTRQKLAEVILSYKNYTIYKMRIKLK